MKAELVHKDGFKFDYQIRDHQGRIDVSKENQGENTGPSPKELLLVAISGCSAMDVVSLLKKFRQNVKKFTVTCEGNPRVPHPRVFDPAVDVKFSIEGEVEAKRAIEAVTLSMTKYCAVSAMVSKAVPIRYSIVLNGQGIHQEQARFEEGN